MKAEELRIGNIISWRLGTGEMVKGQVHAVDKDEIAISDWTTDGESRSRGYMKLSNIFPVPLTEKCLLQSGFVKMSYGFANGGFIVIVYKGQFIFKVVDQIVSYNPIKYVHQLQNLYFATSRVELTINQ